jgi:hypothetical protein
MSIGPSINAVLKKLVFGDTLIPQEFTVGLRDPQKEISVWLHGMGTPQEVTDRHSTACSSPFVICISFHSMNLPSSEQMKQLSLKFRERSGEQRVLGEIELKPSTTVPAISAADSNLLFFEARSVTNHCLPKARLVAHYLLHEYSLKHLKRKGNTSGIEMSSLERRAAITTFIRPHPISLVSVVDQHGGNMFTMNIMGDLGQRRFGFALKGTRTGSLIVERARRLALSTVPLPQAHYVYALAANHFISSLDWARLPFETRPSAAYGFPVPAFAARVREMEVEAIQRIGSHNFFVAKIIDDEKLQDCEIVCAIHGFYQVWRSRKSQSDLKASLIEDNSHKHGCHSA